MCECRIHADHRAKTRGGLVYTSQTTIFTHHRPGHLAHTHRPKGTAVRVPLNHGGPFGPFLGLHIGHSERSSQSVVRPSLEAMGKKDKAAEAQARKAAAAAEHAKRREENEARKRALAEAEAAAAASKTSMLLRGAPRLAR